MNGAHRVLVIGAGSIGERHIRCFAATGRSEIALCEVNPELRSRIAGQYPVSAAFETLEAALESQPDVVVVATPAPLHVPMAAAGVAAGANVLIEKPLSTTLDGIASLHLQAHDRQVIVGVAYVYRCHPALAAMQLAIQQGRIGRPVEIVATCGQHFPLYRPAFRETYYKERATGGGAVQDALTHVMNAGEWLVGPADRLVADVDRLVLDGVHVEDTAHVLTRQGGVMGIYSLNQHQAPNEITITVIGTRGAARFEYHRNQWMSMTEPGKNWHIELVAPLERDTLFTRQADAFLNAVEGRALPLCDLNAGWQTLRVNLAILRSAESGQWERVTDDSSGSEER